MNTNFFFSNFSGTSGISRQNPGISRQQSLISLVSRDIQNFLAPTPSRGRLPPRPKISGPKSLGLGSFFFPDTVDECLIRIAQIEFATPIVSSQVFLFFCHQAFQFGVGVAVNSDRSNSASDLQVGLPRKQKIGMKKYIFKI